LKRSLYTQLENWKIYNEHKPLLLQKAIQVRKALILINLVFITSVAFGDTTLVSELPEAKLRMLDGEYSQLSQYVGGGPLIVDFWTTWCPNCEQQMAYLDKINNHYKSSGLKVLAININNPKIVNKVKPYVKKRNFKFDVAIDPEGKISDALNVTSIPTTLFVDTNGKVWDRQAGFGSGTEKDYIKSLETYFDINHIKTDPINFEKKTALNKNQNINIEF